MKLGDVHNAIMDIPTNTPKHLGNGEQWNQGYAAGHTKALKEAAYLALKIEGFVERLEIMLKSQQTELSAFSENYLTPEQLEKRLEEIKKELGL